MLDELAMDSALSSILSELRSETLSRSDTAADENMRWLVPRKGCDPRDLADFLLRAAEVRLARAREQGLIPATFYSWYDEMAGQVRFSTVPGRSDALPFGASIDLVAGPACIAADALSTWSPGVHSFNELTEVEWEEPAASPSYTLRVWARTTEDAA